MRLEQGQLNQGYRFSVQIQSQDDCVAVSAFLAKRYPHMDQHSWTDCIVQGEVLVRERSTEPSAILNLGDIVIWDRPPWVEPATPQSFSIIHQDADLLVVCKPSGLPTIPGGGFLANTLLSMVLKEFPDARPLHRLGRGTSGLVLFALTKTAATCLSSRWGAVSKTYLALAQGLAARDRYEIDMPIGPVPHPRIGTIFAASTAGKKSRSVANVLERRQSSTLFEVAIETGRPHQIRIHLASVGHPLVGDPIYESGGIPRSELPGLPGDCGYHLHAWRLELIHPVTGSPVCYIAEPSGVLS